MALIAGWRNAATAQVRTVAVSAFVGKGFFQAGLVHGMASFYGVISWRTSRRADGITSAVRIGAVFRTVTVVVDAVGTIGFRRHAGGIPGAVRIVAVYQAVAVFVQTARADFSVRSAGWIKLAVSVLAVDVAVAIIVDSVIADFGGGCVAADA